MSRPPSEEARSSTNKCSLASLQWTPAGDLPFGKIQAVKVMLAAHVEVFRAVSKPMFSATALSAVARKEAYPKCFSKRRI